jgi:hypothetical protein
MTFVPIDVCSALTVFLSEASGFCEIAVVVSKERQTGHR